MGIPDNEDIRSMIERDMERRAKNPIFTCDICGEPIYEGDNYLAIDEWDRCVCESCVDDIGVWRIAE